jgi:hypothetical protein
MFESRKNESRAAATLTLGAARERLIANGYVPVSALDPHARVGAQYGPHMSEHLPAVLCCALVLTPLQDPTLDRRVRALLEKRGLLRGPVRLGSDGGEMRPVRFNNQRWPLAALAERVVIKNQPTVIPLDALWPQGDLFGIPCAQLPEANVDWGLDLFRDIDALPFKIVEERQPPPRPSRRGWLGAP